MHIISNIALITINATFFVQLGSFLIFLFLIDRIMFRPLQRTMGERNTHFLQTQEEVSNAELELEEIQAAIHTREQEVIREAHRMSLELRQEGEIEAGRIETAVQEEISALHDKAEAETRALMREARTQIRSESEKIAGAVVEKLLGRRIA